MPKYVLRSEWQLDGCGDVTMCAKEKEAGKPRSSEDAPETGASAESACVPKEEYDKVVRERDEYLELARRARADYQNLQRRIDAQVPAVRAEAEQRIALDMIAILDDLERALDHIKKGQDPHAVVKGVTLVRENFLSALAGYGITPIEAEGAPFDHNLHHAIAEQPAEGVTPGTVVAVAQRGYLAGGKLLRPAQVVVSAVVNGEGSGEPSVGGECIED